MTRLRIALLPLLLLACGQSCGSGELEQRLDGAWVYQLSEEEHTRQEALEKILSDSPPNEAELRSMGLSSSDLSAALENLRIKTENPDSQMLVEIEKDFRASSSNKKGMHLKVDGNQMVLVMGAQRMGSTWQLSSTEGDSYLIETTDSSGKTEIQTLSWISESHFRLTDPSGQSMEFVRPGN